MSKRNLFAMIALVIMCTIYGYMNNWWRRAPMEIIPSIRPGRTSSLNPDVYPVTFLLDGKYRLLSIKVVSADDARTNRVPRPVWHMIADKPSPETKLLTYGMPLRGMKPSFPRARPEPLQANTTYRLFLEADGGIKGQVDFKTAPATPRPDAPTRGPRPQ